MPIPQRPRFEYGVAGDLTLAYSAKPWVPADSTVGGRHISAAGVPSTYLVRRDALLDLPLRIQESEWPDVLALLQFGQTGAAFYWYPDASNTDPDYDRFLVYLDTPAMGERITPSRDGPYPRQFELTITLRGVGDVVPWLEYFED